MHSVQFPAGTAITKENLRDNMTNIELVLNMLAEATATEVSIVQQPVGFG